MADLVSYTPADKEGSNQPDQTSSTGVVVIGMENGGQTRGEGKRSISGSANKVSPEDPKEEKDEKKKEEPEKMVGVFEIFRFASGFDYFLMSIGSLAAIIHGLALPLMIVVFGDMIDSFVGDGSVVTRALQACADNAAANNITTQSSVTYNEEYFRKNPQVLEGCCQLINATGCTSSNILDQMTTFALYYVGIGVGVMVFSYLEYSMWTWSSERQAHTIRLAFFRSVLHQEIGWFDTHEPGELNTRMSDDISKIAAGINEKLGQFFQGIAAALASLILAFVKGWLLTLVVLAVSPLIILASGIMTYLTTQMTSNELTAYAKAGSVAEEVLGAIRTVVAFGGQDKECDRYNNNLEDAKKSGIKKALTTGAGMGFTWMIIFGAYALGFGYGAHLVRTDTTYTVGNMMLVFFAVIIAAFSLGNATPTLANFGTARGAAYVIYRIIDKVPEINSDSEEGMRPDSVRGEIEFKNIHFKYPSRPDVKVLDGFNLTATRGQTVALVGSSGCGKSTCIQLLQRFYDPEEGQVFLDGVDIKDLNIKWLRNHIGVVSQEPVLFATTIAENIRYGRDGVTQEEIEKAAKEANAHDFISQLPDQYETLVGERGAQLSGGQKQRIAISRALVRDPKILLLDEATSALDTESEGIVQAALDKVRQGRTTLVIAHRLSTIRTADIIVGLEKGVAVEQGTHDELMSKQGVYYTLVTMQSQKKDQESDVQAAVEESDEDEEEVIPETKKSELDRSLSHRDSQRKFNRMTSVASVKSEAKEGEKKEKEEEEEEKLPDPPMKRIFRLNAPEWFYILIGCFSALINGGIQPAFAIIFAEFLGVFVEYPTETHADKQAETTFLYSMILLGLGVLSAIAMICQVFFFAVSGENLTLRLRQLAFRAMLRQDIAYFDDHKNSTGALTTRLATETSAVQGATGARLGTIIQSIANMGTAIIIAFVFSWEMTLLIIAFLPFIAVGGMLEMRLMYGATIRDKEALENAGKTAVEAIENMRTVASLTKEEKFYQLYKEKLDAPFKTSTRQAHLTGLTFGFTQGVLFFAYAAAFKFGAFLIDDGRRNFEDIMKVFSAVVFGAMALGQASSFAPDYNKAKIAASKIFLLFDREPEIDSYSTEGEEPASFQGDIEFKDTHFNYPSRPNVKVLRGLDVQVGAGQRLALVGSSGCGKSTTIQLLERFYDPLSGNVLLDKRDTRSLNISWMRKQMGIVSQEPILFDCSIKDNICYGDNSRQPEMAEVIEAARNANIHSFIESLPDGYDTNVGDKGTQLSGGQKQRVAIARALLRNPKILLLDEATSALDTESEKVVQEALDRAQEGRTSIVIAHRLSTIQNADMIAVIHHGKVREIGKHADLLAKKGLYFKLVNHQLHDHTE
ncbi:multidrug resistance protein 1A isoform X3 [Lingula anatina]|uniref:Multidrug resistance protein 1A isoform X3 n=1 Tax=Lingula anatina TaxID=7574 RepID=A0A2R2MPZ4_LINAN|nr:multidrug resistance protein 1A isoform X3 [Lingula anatina]|eukprot:XP_023932082.1 multidrug resistance protein 1A isoform X3 [Lingula anatina]